MNEKTVVFIGSGDLALRAGTALAGRGLTVIGSRRRSESLPPPFLTITTDYTQRGGLAALEALRPDYVVTTFKPTSRDVAGYERGFLYASQNLLQGLGDHRPSRIVFVSSTRVYAEKEGGWVDENSPLARGDAMAAMMIAAEQTLHDSDIPCTALRCAGIYGDPRGRLLSRIAAGQLCPEQPVSYSNRIHREDVSAFIEFAITSDCEGMELHSAYTLCDDSSVPQHEVECFIADSLGVPQDQRRFDAARMVSGHKRCNNQCLRDSGFSLAYPNYRAGYAAVIAKR